MRKIILYIQLSTLLIFCSYAYLFNESKYLKSTIWLYDTGYRMEHSDHLQFNSTSFFEIKSDTIYHQDKPVAKIINVSKVWGTMKIKSLGNSEIGYYTDFDYDW